MIKTFKFFDLQNNGTVTLDQFRRAVTKIGVVLAKDSDIDQVFSIYDQKNEGKLDYKRMLQMIGSMNGLASEESQVKQAANYKQSKQPKENEN